MPKPEACLNGMHKIMFKIYGFLWKILIELY